MEMQLKLNLEKITPFDAYEIRNDLKIILNYFCSKKCFAKNQSVLDITPCKKK